MSTKLIRPTGSSTVGQREATVQFDPERIKSAVLAALGGQDHSSLNLFTAEVVRASYAQGRETGRYEGESTAADTEKARKESANKARVQGVMEERKRVMTILRAYPDQPEAAATLIEAGLPLHLARNAPPTTEQLADTVLNAGQESQVPSAGKTADKLAEFVMTAGKN